MGTPTSRVTRVLLFTSLAVCCCQAVPLPQQQKNSSWTPSPAEAQASYNVNVTDVQRLFNNVTADHRSPDLSATVPKANKTHQPADFRYFNPLEIVKPIVDVLNSDFGIGLDTPNKLPQFLGSTFGKASNRKPGEKKNTVVAADSLLEPVIAPFRPLAMHFTGATQADLVNLRPQQDLFYPFLDPPKNTFLSAVTPQHLRDSTAAEQDHAAKLTPEQLEQYKKALEDWKQQQNLGIRSGHHEGLPSPRFLGGFLSSGDFSPGFGFDDVVKPTGDLSSLLAASTIPVNPYVSPFIPIASHFTGATPADYFNLKPTQDLVLPFLNPPLNSLLSVLTNNFQLRSGDGSNQTVTTPQQVASLVKSLAEQNKNLTHGINAAHHANPSLSSRTSPLVPPIGFPSIDPLGALAAIDLLHPSILNSFVLPFLPADTNPFLSLLYYLTPTLRAAGDDNSKSSNGTDVGREHEDLDLIGGNLNLLDANVLQSLAPVDEVPKLPIRPFTDLVYPFLPTDTNPLLTLLYYITPYPLRTQERMTFADKAIAASVAKRDGLSPVEAVQHAKRLQNIVAAAELVHTLKRLGLPGAGPLLRAFSPYLMHNDDTTSRDSMEAVESFVNQRLFELKYMAAAKAAMKARYQQRLMGKMGLRQGRQFFNQFLSMTSSESTTEKDHATYEDLESPEEEAAYPDTAAVESSRVETGGEEELAASAGAEETGDGGTVSEEEFATEAADFFASNNPSSPLANLFRFFIPDLTSLDHPMLSEDSDRSARGLFSRQELSPSASYKDAAGFVASEVERHAPFPVNHIWHWWTEKRTKRSSGRQGRSQSGNFTDQMNALREKQIRSLALNDTFANEVATGREGRSLIGGIIGGLLPFPFNLLASFLIPLRQNNQQPAAAGNTETDTSTAGADGEEAVEASQEAEYEEGFDEAGISAEEGDLRMAALVKPFLPPQVDALVGAILPFRSFENDLMVETAAHEADGPEDAADATQHFQQALADVKRQYDEQTTLHQKTVQNAGAVKVER